MGLPAAVLLTAACMAYGSSSLHPGSVNGNKSAKKGVQGHSGIYDFTRKSSEDLTPMVKGNSSSNVGGEVCAEIGPVTWTCPGDTLCCEPGVPESTCCPVFPCCLTFCCTIEGSHCCIGGEEGCCTAGYTCCEDDKCCLDGTKCCEDDKCCPDETPVCCDGVPLCCPEGTECNKEKLTCCPEKTPKACSLGVCCEDEDCCGDNCGCDSGNSCCNDDSCCDDTSTSCCPKGCNGCKYPWSALPCTSETSNLAAYPTADTCPTPGSVNGSIYRILRKEESCGKGLLAKDTSGSSEVTVDQHLACINDSSVFPNSPYIIFSSDPKSLEKLIGQFSSLNLTLAKVDQSKIPSGCTSIDLTNDANRNKYLAGDQRAMTFAQTWCPILIECGKVPIPCTV
ncbi:unnamed protein product [Meganyctiphanes norvegica]|uniref:Granulin n=1 Tax=Meganyctiphanes norvegica TaxID=48144 RepID=A0AAV2RTU2_MEGNR